MRLYIATSKRLSGEMQPLRLSQHCGRYHRRQPKLDEAIVEMSVSGVSIARVGEILKALSR